MTTTPTSSPRSRDAAARSRRGVLAGGVLVALVAALVVAVVGLVVDGGPGLLGALAGGGLGVAVFVFGAVVVGIAAGLMPQASMLVALLTYTLQLLVLTLVFVAFHQEGADVSALSSSWLGLGMIAATLGWITGQLVVTLRTPVEPWHPSTVDTPGETADETAVGTAGETAAATAAERRDGGAG